MQAPLGILYEHPLWFEPLFAELERRGVPYQRLPAGDLVLDPQRVPRLGAVLNRMSPSAWTRGHAHAIFSAAQYLAYVESAGVPVVNGTRAYALELSKARQCLLFERLGIRYPRTRVIAQADRALAAADGLRFPVLVKPNIGGSGAGIVSFSNADELDSAAARGELDLGLDGTALVQERLPAADRSIVRLELLGGELLYAIRIRLVDDGFNLCPADYCELPGVADGVSGRGLPIEAYEPPDDAVDKARAVASAGGLDVCGIEYLVDERDAQQYFYDVNALSNFVAGAPELLGFDPFVPFVDFVLERTDLTSRAAA